MTRAYQCPDCGDVSEDGVCSCSPVDWVAIGNAMADLGRRMSEPRAVQPDTLPDWMQDPGPAKGER